MIAPETLTNRELAHAILRPEIDGDALALRAADLTLSHGELRDRVATLTERLTAAGVGPGHVVAVVLDRGIAPIVAWLGALGAGAAYLPVDPTYPRARIAAMLDDVAPSAVIIPASTDVPLDASLALHRVDAAGHLAGHRPGTAPARASAPADTCYVIFTSGSTGQPKAVTVSTGQLDRVLRWQRGRPWGGEPARTAQFSALSFDVAAQEIFSTLAAGGSLHVLSDDERRDPELLLTGLRTHRVDRLFLPFVALQALAEASAWTDAAPPLRYVATAGEQLLVTPQVRALFTRMPACHFENHYGPSETHVATAYALGGDPATWPDRPPIGRATGAIIAGVLDDRLEPVTPGVHGRLFLSEENLTGGYLNQRALTDERYVPNLLPGGAARMYDTGDVAWVDPDGELNFAGRADDQVKIRGFRVELGEVEAALLRAPAVRSAAATVDRGGGRNVLIGHVHMQDAPADAAERVLAHLRDVLPEWAVPSSIRVRCAPLPVLPSGKVDRVALAREAATLTPVDDGHPPTLASLEEQLAALWTAVLGVPVGPDDDFFEIGGHSLAAVEVVGRIRSELGYPVKIRQVFQARTVAKLAEQVAGSAT